MDVQAFSSLCSLQVSRGISVCIQPDEKCSTLKAKGTGWQLGVFMVKSGLYPLLTSCVTLSKLQIFSISFLIHRRGRRDPVSWTVWMVKEAQSLQAVTTQLALLILWPHHASPSVQAWRCQARLCLWDQSAF